MWACLGIGGELDEFLLHFCGCWVAAGLVLPVGDEVKAGEVINADLGREKEDIQFANVRYGRVCKWTGEKKGKGAKMTHCPGPPGSYYQCQSWSL